MGRTYDEDEAAAILERAAEQGAARDKGGVTLKELESAADEAGLDGALVRAAARDIRRVEEAPRGQRLYGESTRISSRASVTGDVERVAGRLFVEMADRTGEVGTQQEVGEAHVWQTAGFGKGLDAGPGAKASLMVRPVEGGGAELVLREDVDREAATGLGLRVVLTTVISMIVMLMFWDSLGPIDDAIALTVLGTPLYAAAGWTLGKRWWRNRRRQLVEAHEARMRGLLPEAPALPPSEDD